MDTGDKIFMSISVNTRPGKIRFFDVRDERNRPRKLDYSLRIGISDEDAQKVHTTWGGGSGLTVAEAVELLKKEYGFDLFYPLRKHRLEIMNFVMTTVFGAYRNYTKTTSWVKMGLKNRRFLLEDKYSNISNVGKSGDVTSFSTVRRHDISRGIVGDTIKRRLEEYGKYWVEIIRAHILGYDGQLSDETIKVREKKKSSNAAFTYKAGMSQPAVETGLIWDSISYEVTDLTGTSEIRNLHERWAEEGRRKDFVRSAENDYRMAAKQIRDRSIDDLSIDDVVSYSYKESEIPLDSKVKKIVNAINRIYNGKRIYSNTFDTFKQDAIGIAREIISTGRRAVPESQAKFYATQSLFYLLHHADNVTLDTSVVKTEWRR